MLDWIKVCILLFSIQKILFFVKWSPELQNTFLIKKKDDVRLQMSA